MKVIPNKSFEKYKIKYGRKYKVYDIQENHSGEKLYEIQTDTKRVKLHESHVKEVIK